MTLPPSNAHFAKLQPRRLRMISPMHPMHPTHSMPSAASAHGTPQWSPRHFIPSLSTSPLNQSSQSSSFKEKAESMYHEQATNFSIRSLDLATGGLKTMTAKREMPARFDRRLTETSVEANETSSIHKYQFALLILVCIVLMLTGSGVILFVILQP